MIRSKLFLAAMLAIVPAVGSVSAQNAPKEKGKLNQYGNPMKIAPRPTKATIDEADLRTRLYIFADDSMMGRQINTLGNKMGTDYIASEAKRIGLEPAGDNGTYFQIVPFAAKYYSAESQLSGAGRTFKWGDDVVASSAANTGTSFADVQVIYGGVAGDTTTQISPAQAVGRFVILSADPAAAANAGGGAGGRGAGGGRAGGGRAGGGGGAGGRGAQPTAADLAAAQRAQLDSLRGAANDLLTKAAAGTLDSTGRRQLQAIGQRIYTAGAAGGGRGGAGGGRGGFGGGGGATARFAGAVAVATADLDLIDVAQRGPLNAPGRAVMQNPGGPTPAAGAILGAADAPIALRITRATAEALMGIPLTGLRAGAGGKTASGRLVVASKPSDHPEYARNVVAVLRGSDATLRAEYVAIGAHNDHVGLNNQPADHDSLEAFLNAQYQMRMADGKTVVGPTQAMTDSARKAVNVAALRKNLGPGRLDSIRNGADDDGSGSMAVLEIAEALANAPEKPKRSIIFVWHTGEESGLQGSAYFTNHPTVPRDKIVAQINIDMIGRGRVDDLPGGGPDYLGVVGSNKLSSDLAKMVADENTKQKKPLKLDYQFDEPSLWDGYNNIYGRSDHANYARYNIPIAFFFTGLHRDYHQVTDEPQYIDYPHYTRITNYIRDLMVAVGNGARPRLDKGPAQ